MYSRVTVAEAAELIGISQHAVRQRINRRTLEHEKSTDGRVYVLLDTEQHAEQSTEQSPTLLVEALQDRIASLEKQLATAEERDRENRRLLAAALERIPAIEPPEEVSPEPQESPENASAGAEGVEVPLKAERPSWWRRMFGG